MRKSIAVAALALLSVSVDVSADTSTPSAQERELFSGLLSWAVKLSPYPAPATTPTVEFVPQAFFERNACGGRHCSVWGWYPNTGRNVVYVHEAVRDLLADNTNPRSLLAASVIVHEFVHYLQAASRGFAAYKCEQALALEREAYELQSAYIVSYGRYIPVGVSMHGASCEGSAGADVSGAGTEQGPPPPSQP